jgi:hypothetical protein
MRKIASEQAKLDVGYVLLKERIKFDSDPQDRLMFEFRLRRNLDAIGRVAALLREHRYDRIIIVNGAVLEFGAVYNFVTSLSLPASTFELWGDGTIGVSRESVVMSLDTSDAWAQDAPHVLAGSRYARVQVIMKERQRPSLSSVTFENIQVAGLTPADWTRAHLGLQVDKPVILVCPNVPFDAMFYSLRDRNFRAMWEWLVKTVEYLSRRTDCQVIIRSHPAEVLLGSEENTSNLIREFFPVLPFHIRILGPEAPLNTYSIMDIADLGIVYASTTGLEMAMRGIPVICAVKSHYNAKGFTLDPNTPEEYFSLIDDVLQNPKVFRLTSRQIELALCYADIFFNEWLPQFPWRVGPRLWRDLKEWPIARMLSSEGDERFGGVLDKLIGL